jgi:hypothetical protein
MARITKVGNSVSTGSHLGFEATLWATADKLRGNLDAAEYKHVVVEFATTASVGTTIPSVRWDALECYEIALPPEPRLEAFEKAIAPLVQRSLPTEGESRTRPVARRAAAEAAVGRVARAAAIEH